MKITRFISLAFYALSLGLWAQQAPPGFKIEPMPMPLNRPANADDHLYMLTEQLNLTHPQQDKIRPIVEKYLKQRHAILLSKSLSQDAKSNKLKVVQDSEQARIRGLLNPAQKKKFDDLMGISEPPHHGHTKQAKRVKAVSPRK
jgi:Spy/CpxP family protein refolding chaperone